MLPPTPRDPTGKVRHDLRGRPADVDGFPTRRAHGGARRRWLVGAARRDEAETGRGRDLREGAREKTLGPWRGHRVVHDVLDRFAGVVGHRQVGRLLRGHEGVHTRLTGERRRPAERSGQGGRPSRSTVSPSFLWAKPPPQPRRSALSPRRRLPDAVRASPGRRGPGGCRRGRRGAVELAKEARHPPTSAPRAEGN